VVWLVASLVAPALTIVLSVAPRCSGCGGGGGPPVLGFAILAFAFSLAAIAVVAPAAGHIRRGDGDRVRPNLGCAALVAMLPAALLAIPSAPLAALGVYGVVQALATRNAPDPRTSGNLGCALIVLLLGALALGYAIPALIGGAMLRGVARALRRR